MSVLVAAWVIVSAVSCLALLYSTAMLVRRCPQLGSLRYPDPATWPALGVVIPACNEAATIDAVVTSLLAQDYPGSLEIVLVDDRSTDATGAIVDRLAARDPRVTAIHLHAVPDGWLGKVHALQRGLERVRGEFVLFTDADVHFAPGALRRALAWAQAERLDHVTVFAQVRHRTFWVGVVLSSSLRAVMVLARPWRATDQRSPAAIGTGAFNLVRRAAFERTPGFAWLRLEVADDIGVGVMMKRHGGRAGVAIGRGQIVHDAYATFGAAVRGLEKNGFAQAARFSAWRGLTLAALGAVGSFGLYAAFLPVGVPWLWMVGAAGLAMYAVAAFVGTRASGTSLVVALASLPLGDLAMAWIVARATVLGVWRGGLVWRGTTYPTALLRAGRRVAM